MSRFPITRSALLALAALALAGPLTAQQTRDARLKAAFAAYDNFQEDQALQLLRDALNPSEGPADSLWFRGVEYLAEILITRSQQAEAAAWLRWAYRLEPNASVDSVTFIPELVSAARGAQQAVAGGSPGDSVTGTTYQWVAPGAPAGRGMLRIESPGMAQPVNALVQGVGASGSGRTITLAPGTYEVQAAAQGYLAAVVRREVLPGVTTVLSFHLAPVAVAAAPTPAQPAPVSPPPQVAPPAPKPAAPADLTDLARAGVERQILPVTVQRFGAGQECATAAFVGRSGLLLTTYTAIRGAEQVAIELAGGRRLSGDVRVAAYDMDADVAVLQIPAIRTDSLALTTTVQSGQALWAFGFPDCVSSKDQRVAVAGATAGGVQLRDSVPGATHPGPLVDAQGVIVGLVTGPQSAVGAARIAQVLDQARRNVVAGNVQTVAQVALRENQAYGSVALSSDLTGAQARITPLETWQWPETATSGALPLTFVGPMGRYHLQLSAGGQVQRETEFTVRPAVADRLAVTVQAVAAEPQPAVPQPQAKKKGGGGAGIILAVVGIGAAGAAVAVLASKKSSSSSGGGNPPPPTGAGSIQINVPNPSIVGAILRFLGGHP